ncbi:nuclear transport factor 2 family protein [uncultured Shimia sp.]|uniref:nuclear transport factor 2 family protein n=1 Tax=uncultured Shimia sp. TaxID=573152 RepID=UPI002604FD37|nr:nuclear transport factor 2 family protein [uncultured Shimia sp.]
MDNITLEDCVALETRVWQALVSGDSEADGALLSADFLGVYPSGFSDRAGHMEQLSDGPSMAEFQLSETRLMEFGPGRVLLAYRADYRTPNATKWQAMLISSLWESIDGQWINRFSQDTPVT